MIGDGIMSRKNNLKKNKEQHEMEVKREKARKEKTKKKAVVKVKKKNRYGRSKLPVKTDKMDVVA